jgi:2-oxoisovalerate dehydrogenase E1 component
MENNKSKSKVNKGKKELDVQAVDAHDLDVHPNTLKNWYKLMHLGRLLDEKAARYLKMSKGWSYHAPCAGHEGIQLAMGVTFRPGKDFLFPYYRDLMTALAGGISPEEIILNGLSKDADVAGGGRHMSNHFAKPSMRIQNVSSCTGNHSLHAVGVARAIKKYDGDEISIYSSGESATSEGYFYEAVSGACREQLPVIFVIQNNGYGISVPVHEQSANTNISDNFRGFKNLRVLNCDGTNIFDSWRTMQEAVDYVKQGHGPAMVHAECVRIGAHSNSDRHELYRTPEEIEEAATRDPLYRFHNFLSQNGVLSEEEFAAIETENQEILDEAATKAEAAPDPDPKSVYQFVFPDDTHVCPVPEEVFQREVDKAKESGKIYTYREAINETLKEEFRRNPNTFLWGQDVASREKGGIFNVTKGMMQEFGNERIFNAPIAEDFVLGTANGFSRYRDDIWVVVEGAEFADYFWPAMEQLVETTHEYWRTKGQFSPNIVVRLASGGYIQGGLYHSQSIEGSLAALPGLRIIVPSSADDATGLMRCAMRTRGITMYLEPKILYNHAWAKSPRPSSDYCVPLGRARVRQEGADLSIITYGTPVHFAMQAAKRLKDEENIDVEIIDLRTLIPLDKETIAATVRKTGKALVVHEANRTGGYGGEIASIIAEEHFEYLDAPVMRMGSKDIPVGFAKNLEDETLLNANEIYEAALKLARY